MAELEQPVLTLTAAEEQQITPPEKAWSDAFALKIVLADFQRAESYRSAAHDWRWREHDRLYEAWTQQLYWEGTRIPRSSVPIFLCFEQIESITTKVIAAIFADNPWFQVDHDPTTKATDAVKARDLVRGQLDQCQVRTKVLRWIKSGLIYGNGILELSWIQSQRKLKRYHFYYKPKSVFPSAQPTGFERVAQLRDVIRLENRPELI